MNRENPARSKRVDRIDPGGEVLQRIISKTVSSATKREIAYSVSLIHFLMKISHCTSRALPLPSPSDEEI